MTTQPWEEQFFVSKKGVLRLKTILIDGKQYYRNANLSDIAHLLLTTKLELLNEIDEMLANSDKKCRYDSEFNCMESRQTCLENTVTHRLIDDLRAKLTTMKEEGNNENS